MPSAARNAAVAFDNNDVSPGLVEIATLGLGDSILCNGVGENHTSTAILDLGFKLLEEASAPRTTEMAPFEWSQGSEWKELVFTEARPWKSGEDEQDWLRKKALYKSLKAEGKV